VIGEFPVLDGAAHEMVIEVSPRLVTVGCPGALGANCRRGRARVLWFRRFVLPV